MILAVLGVYVISILPYMYQGTRNSLRNVNARQLLDAADLLGASKVQAFRKFYCRRFIQGYLSVRYYHFLYYSENLY